MQNLKLVVLYPCTVALARSVYRAINFCNDEMKDVDEKVHQVNLTDFE